MTDSTNADDVTVIQADRDMVEEMDEALGFITERERPILLAAFARHRIAHQAAEVERLRNLLCLADELLMEAKGAFPLPGNPLRDAYLKIRAVTGNDYHLRKERAGLAIKGE